MKIDERIGGDAGDAASTSVANSVAEAVYWLVFLLFLPAILGALALEGLLQPVQSLVDELLGFLPNILGAGLILVVGWFMANLVRRIVTNLLASIGADGLAERIGVRDSLGTMRLSGLIGLIVYVLILLPVLIAALNALAIDAVTAPASEMLSSILNAIPALFGVAILIAIAYFVGRVVADLISKVLAGAGFDNILVTLGLAKAPAGGRKPSEVIGTLILVSLMLFASIEAAGLLGFAVLGELISRFLVLAGQVVLGLISLRCRSVPRERRGGRGAIERHTSGGPAGVDRPSLDRCTRRCDGAAPDGAGQRQHQPGLWATARRCRRGRRAGVRTRRARCGGTSGGGLGKGSERRLEPVSQPPWFEELTRLVPMK